MAVIKPFRGVRYNPELTPNMQAVVSQPYDRISSKLRAQYFGLSPYNISHIILGHLEDDQFPTRPDGSHQANGMHGPSDAVYFKAKAYYEDWLNKQVFIRDDAPAIYAYEQTFTIGGAEYVRLGMIAAVELHEFEEGVILPHERTHSGPKADRLKLLSTMQVNTEQIFLLYPDPENRVNALLRQAIAGARAGHRRGRGLRERRAPAGVGDHGPGHRQSHRSHDGPHAPAHYRGRASPL